MPDDNNLEPAGPAGEEAKFKLSKEHPAEAYTFVAALVVVAAALGLDLSTEVVVAALVVIGGLPTMVTWAVNLYRDAARQLGD